MLTIIKITLKGIFRDRLLHGIMVLALLFLFIPSAASLSMRQVTELSITLSLSLISFIMLLLSTFLGSTTIWRDIERRYTFSVLSLPLSRSSYLVGRFLGIAFFIIIAAIVLGSMASISIEVASIIFPPARPLLWSAIVAAITFDALKYIIIVGIAVLFSTFSTSFFLPVFGAISIFMAGTITQPVYDYLQTPSALTSVSALVREASSVLYYLLPNLNGFDLKVNAIYSIPLSGHGLMLTIAYFLIYVAIVMSTAAMLFSRSEMK